MAQCPLQKDHSKSVEVQLQHCSGAKFYDFFKNTTYLLPAASGSIVTNIELTDGTTSWVACKGSRKQLKIKIGLEVQSFKDEVEEVHDSTQSISYKVLEGPILALYKNFRFKLTLTNGNTMKWTATYEKTSPLVPDPDLYLNLLCSVSVAVDLYLSKNC